MAIDFNELFTRIGHIGKFGYVLAGYEAGMPTLLATMISDYVGTNDEDLIGGIISAEDRIPAAVVNLVPSVASISSSVLVRMVQTDVPSINSLPAALTELIRQMDAAAQSVKASAVTITPTALTTNVGTGVLVTTTKRGDGRVQENTVAETLRLSCTADSYTGNVTAGEENFTLQGAPQKVGLWEDTYPTGSNAQSATTVNNPDSDAQSTGNVLTNGDFEDWTSSAADNWQIGGGSSWGTEVLEDTTNPFRGTSDAKWVASANNTFIYQQFSDSANGTSASLTPLTSYAINLWLRKESGTISAGVLTVELVDGSGTVINDEQGVANSFTVTLTALTTSYVAYNGVFRIPNVPPSTVRLRLRLSTALAGANFLMDDVCMARVTGAYAGGFGYALFAGASPFVAGDGWNIVTTNDRGGASYLATFQALFDRLFDMKGKNMLLPSSGAPTQADTKITT